MTNISTSTTTGITLDSPGFTNPVTIALGVTVSGPASSSYAIYAPSGSWTVTNAGQIVGQTGTIDPFAHFPPLFCGGIRLPSGTITNLASGDIVAGVTPNFSRPAVDISAQGQFINAGQVHGFVTTTNGTVVNQPGGTITGQGFPGAVFSSNGILINGGLVQANTTGAWGAGISVTNQTGGTISGSNEGVLLDTNSFVTNAAGGLITSGTSGIRSSGDVATIDNSGAITGQKYGISSAATGNVPGITIINSASGAISGGTNGVDITGPGTLITSGTISGAAKAVAFHAGAPGRLAVSPGAVFSGMLDGGNPIGNGTVTTLELTAGSGPGTITGLGSTVINFGSIVIDGGADWLISGTPTGLAGSISGFTPGDRIELTGIFASGFSFSNGVLTITEASGVDTLHFVGSFATSFFHVTNTANGAVITTLPTSVTVAGAGGDLVTVPFTSVADLATASTAFEAVNTGIGTGAILPFTATSGAAIPTVPAGLAGAVLTHTGGGFTVPAGYTSFASDAPGAVTLTGGAANGQAVLAGSGGLFFNAGAGSGTVVAAGGNNLLSAYPGAGNQTFRPGDGNNTVVLLGGDDIVFGGTGSNQILTGKGSDTIYTNGSDLIAAGDIGNATITAGANNPVAFFGPGQTVFNGGSGKATVVSTVGRATINSSGGSQIWLGTFQDVVNSAGADTIIGGTGSATVNAASGNSFVFAGSGALDWFGGSGAGTVLGSAAGSAMLHGGSGTLVALSTNGMTYAGGTGAATVAAFGGALTVSGGGGGGVFLGGPAGHNVITGGNTPSIILGGGAGDVLTAGNSAGDVIQAASGAATISTAGTNGSHRIYAGSGPDLISTGSGSSSILLSTGAATIMPGSGIDLFAFANGNHPNVVIQGFSPLSDFISFIGFPAGEAAAALAGATSGSGSEVLTLSDGTHITLLGFTGLPAANIL